MTVARRPAAIALLVVVLALAIVWAADAAPEHSRQQPQAPGAGYPWQQRVDAAKRFAADRHGEVAFAVVDETGTLRGYRADKRFDSASVVKAMLMVAYLRQGGVRHRALTAADRRLLVPMIRHSANGPASEIYRRVGARALHRIANEAHMKHFSTQATWGLTQITASDQARFMYTLERYIPKRHRDYALRLMTRIIERQRWGVPPATPPGWTIHFKGGWAPNSAGWRINQVALLTNADRRLAVTVLTRRNPDANYGHKTVLGVARRLLDGYE